MADELQGDELQARAKELNIKGRTSMSAEELRTAVEEAEAHGAKDAAEDVETTGDEADGMDTFTVGDLRRRPGLTGYRGFEVAGAYAGTRDEAVVSLKEAKSHVADWLDAPVTV